MLPAWVMGFADGTETGTYLALDLGGTNLRVCNVVLLKEGRKYDMIQSKYRLVCDCSTNPVPNSSLLLYVLGLEKNYSTTLPIVWPTS